MCRNIKILFNFDPPVTAEEVRAASLQFVRKISGFNKPSKANEASFLAAVDEIAGISTGFCARSKPMHRRRTEKKRPQKRNLARPKDSAPEALVNRKSGGRFARRRSNVLADAVAARRKNSIRVERLLDGGAYLGESIQPLHRFSWKSSAAREVGYPVSP